ncbi:MAG TPA: DNA methyltransferase [Planctomycetaceae bacterium]|jgi:hypothetical protein
MPPNDLPHKIDQALTDVCDQSSFVQRLLVDALNWPIDSKAERIEDISYGWTQDELRAVELEKYVVEGQISQIQLTADQPWGIFLLEFKSPDAFVKGRGIDGPLRQVLRGLVPSRRKGTVAGSWGREHLLFICTHRYKHYRIAYFKSPPDKKTLAPLATFGWGPDVPARTACEFNLPALTWPDDTTSETWVRNWTSAFDVERVTKRFYEQYARAFADVEWLIGGNAGLKDPEELRMFTQTLFNRLMFLRFIERKNWLEFGGRHDYLRTLFEAGGIRKNSLYQSRIRPLFFQGLAVDGKELPDVIGKVPFLNGGLFEENELDRQVTDIPDDALAPMIARHGLFYSFNFTIEESTPLEIEVAVDPEMLGKVFEELVTGRHETGSYYTPRPIVSFMCREALKGYLTDRTNAPPSLIAELVDERSVERLREAHAREILTALDNLKAADPACGSGAYLLGLLHELVAVYRLLYSERLVHDGRSLYDLKLRIISHNLYGVDQDRFATNIAMLRLWLSLAVEADEPIPLPNLDFKIKTGDSLLGPCSLPTEEKRQQTLGYSESRDRADLLLDLKDDFLKSHGKAKERIFGEISRTEAAIAEELHSRLGGEVVDWRIQFADVIGRNKGFDIVLANPPYVRQELIGETFKEQLLQMYPTATDGKSDLYCYFYARGLQLLRDGGMHVFICSNSWLDVGFGTKLQEYLLSESQVMAIYDSTVERQFATADVNTIISILKKRRPGRPVPNAPTHFITLRAPFEIAIRDPAARRELVITRDELWNPAGSFGGSRDNGKYRGGKWGGRYLRAPDSFFKLLEVRFRLIRLGDELCWSFGRGRRTGCDDFFYLTSEQIREWNIEDRFLRRLVKSPSQFRECPPLTSKLHDAFHVFLCHEDTHRLADTGALRYIQNGEKQGIHKKNLTACGGRWYDLGQQSPAHLILPIAFHERFFVIANDAAAEAHQRFATFAFQPGYEHLVAPTAALLSSSLVALLTEVLGRHGLGQGALDFPPEDWREMLLPNALELSESELAELAAAWQTIRNKVPVAFAQTVSDSDFLQLDRIVAHALGLDESFMQEVRQDALAMVQSRITKAKKVGA